MRIAIIQGHPDPQGHHFGHALADAYVAGAVAGGHETTVVAVAHLTFPLLRSRDDLEHGSTPAAIVDAQSTISRADHLVMIYPVWNGGMPAVLRGFLEQTFRPAFIFPDLVPGQALGFSSWLTQRKAFTGRSARIIATMQMPAFVYRWYFHPHPERNTLSLAGYRPIRETLIGLVESPDSRGRERWLRDVHALGHRAA